MQRKVYKNFEDFMQTNFPKSYNQPVKNNESAFQARIRKLSDDFNESMKSILDDIAKRHTANHA